MPVPAMEAVAPADEGAFGWTAFGEVEEEAGAMPVAEESAPPEAEMPAPVEAVAPADEGAFGWTAFGEVEEAAPPEAEMPAPAAEAVAPPPIEEPAPSVVEEVMAEAVAAPLAEELPSAVEEIVAPSAPAPPVARPAVPTAKAPPRPPTGEAADPFAVEKAYLRENPRDYDARLKLARALWQSGRREEALEAYSRLVRSGKLLDVVITELEEYLEKWPDVETKRVLGDAYMKNDQLDKALEIYRQALESL